MLLRLEDEIKVRAKANMLATQNNKAAKQKSAEQITPVVTRKEVAKLAGVSHDTISKVKVIKVRT